MHKVQLGFTSEFGQKSENYTKIKVEPMMAQDENLRHHLYNSGT